MPPKRKKRQRKTGPAGRGHHLKVAVSVLFLLGFLIACLVLLAEWRESSRWNSVPGTFVATNMESPTFAAYLARVEEALEISGVLEQRSHAGEGEKPVSLEVTKELPAEQSLDRLARQLAALSPRLGLEILPEKAEVLILWDGDLQYLLRFQPPAPPVRSAAGPRLAIIMDDLGRDMATARELLAVELPVTFAVLPNTAQAAGVATIAHRRGREVIIHLPMEPQHYPERNPGRQALFIEFSREEIRRRMSGYLDRIPYAVGGNNHMGSRFTESSTAMASVLEMMKEEGLFFVDSLTTGQSVAYAEARRMGIPAAKRDVFLDNERDVEKILGQIRLLAQLAVREGQAVGICHPYPQTLDALRRAVPYLERAGVTVVPVSRLLDR